MLEIITIALTSLVVLVPAADALLNVTASKQRSELSLGQAVRNDRFSTMSGVYSR